MMWARRCGMPRPRSTGSRGPARGTAAATAAAAASGAPAVPAVPAAGLAAQGGGASGADTDPWASDSAGGYTDEPPF